MKNQMLNILSMSSWSFIMVATTLLFGFIGMKFDSLFKTEPTFFMGFIFLSVVLCAIRFYKEITKLSKG
jgi:Mg2+ and Co2+ transporter CorA